jgi:putative flippase GtrA
MLKRRVLTFVAVGVAAAAVHFALVLALAEVWHWPPLLANPAGWALAFVVSYSGHRGLTFADTGAPLARSVRRFFVVSASGFVVNQSAYALLLMQAGMEYRVALAVVLTGVAALTFMASRRWAFLGNPTAPRHRAAPPTDPDRG